MKNIKNILIITFIASFIIASCVQDSNFEVPKSLGLEENAKLTALLATATEAEMADVKAMYQTGDFIEAVETNIYVKGYVTSSDQFGNFFKEFYIQDRPSNPTMALKIILNQVDSYNQFNKGREVFINLKGLYIGEERVGNGVITIGGGIETNQFGTSVTQLGVNQIKANLLRSANTLDMTPLVFKLSQIANKHVGMLVKVENVEFANILAGKRYFDPIQDFDTQRTLQDCNGFSYSQFQLETSGFASFQNELLPTGNGNITAVVSKTFDGSHLVLALNTTADVSMTNTRCQLLNPNDFEVQFEETFESMAVNTTVSGNGWIAFAEIGTVNWRVVTTTDTGNPGSKIAQISVFGFGNQTNSAWLISPAINLDTQDLEFVNFQSSNAFPDGSELELFISTNWNGARANITTANWTPLLGTIVPDSTPFQDWIDSGLIDLSNYSGTSYIAFKYTGGVNSTNTIGGTYQIDNYKIFVKK